jgi:solute carrier family 25 protein 38
MTLNLDDRNVPGFAMYMTGLTQLRILMAKSPYFARTQSSSATKTTVLPTLTTQGNLISGATTRVAVGFLLNPFSVLKARYEVSPGSGYVENKQIS